MNLASSRLKWMRAIVTGLAFLGMVAVGSALASEPETGAVDGPARAFFAAHCRTCHAGEKPKGDFRIESLTADFLDKANRDRWWAVLEHIKAGTMPPQERPRPPLREVEAVAGWISRQATAAQAADGRVV